MNLNMSPQTAGYIINGAMKLDAARQQGDADSVEKVIADMRKLREWCEHSPLDNLIDRLEAIGKSK
jgi:hypothetical protein